ncbi:uncharacterized protein YjiS (DUF1127 family) [Pseudomonas sp. LP_7_YM]|nr:uncharacterized protein YjiS (DUF1127 family) [Pseudomonas sp. LP_7_YM]
MKNQKGFVWGLNPLSRYAFPKRALAALTRQIARWHKLYHQRVELASLSDDALKDIGLSRADVYEETERPFWYDPIKR